MSSSAKLAKVEAAGPTERPPPPSAESLLGEVLDGRYRIEAKIGEGGLGTVYRAKHLKLERSVAIKVLKAELRAIPDIRHRFEREVRTLAALSHPNIVTITDYGEAAGAIPYLVMDLVEGQELTALLGERMAPARGLSVIRQILSSLAYAHAHDVVHRDLKPANVIVTPMPDGSDHAVVLDFGLAKFVGDDAAPGHDLTRSGLVVGTPAYLPPEQIGGGAKRADARSDLYAVGLILFEVLTGRRPFITEDAAEMLRAHLATKPPTLAEVTPGARVSPALEALVAKALEKQPADRFKSARRMLEALDALGSNAMDRGQEKRKGEDRRVGAMDPTGKILSDVEIELDSVTTKAEGMRAAARANTFVPSAPGSSMRLALFGAVGFAATLGLGFGIARFSAPAADPPAVPPLVGEPDEVRIAALAGPAAPEPRAAPPAPTLPESGELERGGEVSDPVDDEGDVEVTEDSEFYVNPDLIELDVEPPVDGTTPPADDADLVEDSSDTHTLVVVGRRPPPRNPWIGRVPRQLARLRASEARGGLNGAELRSLTRYRNEHALDVRPRLLLGHAFVSRGWLTVALDQYERALGLDLACRGEPELLLTLVRIARTEGLTTRASTMIVTAYGAEAREAVDRAIARERDDGARGRLQVLRARL